MRKNLGVDDPLAATPRDPHGRAKWSLRLGVACLILGPIAIEFGLLWWSRWGAILGHRLSVRTPVLDQTARVILSTQSALMETFRRVPWRSDLVLLVGIASCLACMTLLRGRQAR